MRHQLEQYFLQIRQASGAEVIILEDDSFIINASRAVTKGNSITHEKEVNGLHQLAQLKKTLDCSAPVSVVINGKGVLIKKTNEPGINGDLQTVFPNANPNDFYYESFPVKDGRIVSIIRKETADRVIREFRAAGYRVLSVSPGFGTLTAITPFLQPGVYQQLESDSLLIQVNDTNDITGHSQKEQVNHNKFQAGEYLVANQYVKPSNILSFAAATSLLADDLKRTSQVNEKALAEDRKEYRYYKLFKAAGWALLLFTLALLLINFFIYNHYFSRNKAVAETMLSTNQQKKQYSQLEIKIKQKERFLEQSGWTEASRTSLYADRIAGLVPAGIHLQSMVIYPAGSSFSENPGMHFKKDTITITGSAGDPADLSQLMNSLKLLPEFKDVQVKNYVVKNETGIFNMEIVVK